MRILDENLSQYFTELGQQFAPEGQQKMLETLLEARDYVTCVIAPDVLSPDAEGDLKVDMDMPFMVEDFGAMGLYVFGDAYALNYVRLGELKDEDWYAAGRLFYKPENRQAYKEANNLTDDSLLTLVHFDPKSYFVGQHKPDGIAEVVPAILPRMQ